MLWANDCVHDVQPVDDTRLGLPGKMPSYPGILPIPCIALSR
jgi:hypothetical protein